MIRLVVIKVDIQNQKQPPAKIPLKVIMCSERLLLLLKTCMVNFFWNPSLIRNDIVGVIARLDSSVVSIINMEQIAALLNVIAAAKERVHFFESDPLSFWDTATIVSTFPSSKVL